MSTSRAAAAVKPGFKPALWTTGDWNTFFGFGTNILVNMLVLRRDHGATRRGIRMRRRHDLKDAVPFRSKRKRVKQLSGSTMPR